MNLRALLLTSSIVMCLAAVPLQQPRPEIDSTEGRRAFDDLAAFYADPSKSPGLDDAMKTLATGDVAQRQLSSRYLVAIFAQSQADEQNGRAVWQRSPFWGGGAESPAQNFRKRAVEAFLAASPHEESIEPAIWLIDNDPIAEDEAAGITVLRKIKSPKMTDVLRRLLAPHPNTQVAVGAIEEVGSRRLKSLAPNVAALCNHYRQPIREAARKQTALLGFTAPADFTPEKAFTPALEQDLRDMASMVMPEIAVDTKWKRFEVTTLWRGQEPQVREFSGWLLEETADSYRVLDLFSVSQIVKKSETRISDRTLTQDADELVAVRKGNNGEAAAGALSSRGMLTAQFQPNFISVPEALLSAWCLARGDRATAAKVIFPRCSEVADERWIKQVVRDQIGWVYHDQMLHAFSYDRDYPRTIAIAQHLSKPVFDGYRYQDRAKEIAEQLSKRGDDFKTFVLPTPADWKNLKSTMNRPQQIEFLAAHLRLLNCFQQGQPGGVSYEDDQYAQPRSFDQDARHAAKEPAQVINPFRELSNMNLEIRDLGVLVPALNDSNYMLVFSYWRDFHPDRTVHRVNWVITQLINQTAQRDLVQFAKFDRLDAGGRQQHLAQITEWINANAGKSRTELLLENIRTLRDFREFQASAIELVRAKNMAAIPVFVKRAPEFGENAGDVIAFCYRLAPDQVVDNARKWIHSPDIETRFWAAMILLHSGDRANLEGFAEAKSIIEHDEGGDHLVAAFDELLATKRDNVIRFAATTMLRKGPGFDFSNNFAPMLHRLILLGRPEAIDYITAHVEDTTPSGASSGQYQGKDVQRNTVKGDDIARQIAEWRTDKYEYSTLAPDDVRAAERAKLKLWMLEQYQLIRLGKKSQISDKPQHLYINRGYIDAP